MTPKIILTAATKIPNGSRFCSPYSAGKALERKTAVDYLAAAAASERALQRSAGVLTPEARLGSSRS
jgi:hypothetical protein